MAGQSLKSHFEQARRVWWYMTTIPELRRLKEESDKFKASLSYLGRPCLNTHTHFKKKKKKELLSKVPPFFIVTAQ